MVPACSCDLDAPLGEIGDRLDRIAVGNLGHLEVDALEEAGQDQIEGAGDRGAVELAGLRPHQRHQLTERADLERCRDRDADERIGDPRDRHQVARAVRQL
jgi:hypothetical protein